MPQNSLPENEIEVEIEIDRHETASLLNTTYHAIAMRDYRNPDELGSFFKDGKRRYYLKKVHGVAEQQLYR